ncbi:MAG: methyl-accepting chemotaxis protein, partial [Sphingomonadaceae bacterium]
GLLGLGALCMVQINNVYSSANYANTNSLPSIEKLDNAAEAMFRMRIAVWKHVAHADKEGKVRAMADIVASEKKIAAVLDQYQAENISDARDRALLEHDRAALASYYAARNSVLALSDSGATEQASARQLAIQDQIKPADAALKQHRDYNQTLAAEASQRAASNLNHAGWVSAIIVLSVTLCVAAAGIWLVRQLVEALRRAVQLADAVAAGHLDTRLSTTRSDEIGLLQQALSRMSNKLTSVIGEVQRGAHAIQTASSEIASGNMDLSARTEQQAGALEETASSMEELTSTVQHNADNAVQAQQLATDAARTAEQGGAVVGQVVETMSAIRGASTRIVDIISVIDGIAFQTNILALNAAVEAARAGEQGRGFAVVATEVRNLAQRSAAAAKEIKDLIDASVVQVRQGGVLVDQAGLAMQRIVSSVQKVAGVIGEISGASREQSHGIQQVNGAITQMDDMTQQNAALVEQSAAAAVAMREQAEALSALVSQFHLQAAAPAAQPTARVRTARRPAPALAYA